MVTPPVHHTLIPGQVFPALTVAKVGGGELELKPSSGKPRIVVIYRGAFCPFCRGTLSTILSKKPQLDAEGIEIVAVSADKEDAATGLVKELGLDGLTVGYGLTEPQMTQLGVFISDPTHYLPQTHRFSEPASFFLKPDGTIKYLEYASMPMGGRINIDNYIAGYKWSTQNAIEHPEFASVVWGSVPQKL